MKQIYQLLLTLSCVAIVCVGCTKSTPKERFEEEVDDIQIRYSVLRQDTSIAWTIRNDSVIQYKSAIMDKMRKPEKIVLPKSEADKIKELTYRLFVYHTSRDILKVHECRYTDFPGLHVIIQYKSPKSISYDYYFGHTAEYSQDFKDFMAALHLWEK